MIRVVVLYPQTGGNWFKMDYYKNNHIPLVKRLFEPYGMEKVELDVGIAGLEGPAPYFAIAYLNFKNMDQFQKAMAEHGKTLSDDMSNYTKDVIIQVGETVNI
jgi:uncharacterized protein (TIGR02118 family)